MLILLFFFSLILHTMTGEGFAWPWHALVIVSFTSISCFCLKEAGVCNIPNCCLYSVKVNCIIWYIWLFRARLWLCILVYLKQARSAVSTMAANEEHLYLAYQKDKQKGKFDDHIQVYNTLIAILRCDKPRKQGEKPAFVLFFRTCWTRPSWCNMGTSCSLNFRYFFPV